MRTNRIIKAFLSCCFLGALHSVAFALPMAKTISNVTCPSAEEIQHYQFEIGFPYGFDSQLNLPKYAVGASSGGLLDNAMGDYNEPYWALIMYPLHVGQYDEIQDVTQSTLNKLVPASATPFTSEVAGGLTITFCAYTLPGDPSVSALAYYDDESGSWDDDDEDDDDMDDDYAHKKSAKAVKSGIKRHHKHLMHFAKLFMK